MKKYLIIIGSILALLFVLVVSKDLIIKAAVEKDVEVVTGLKLNIGLFRVGIFNSVVDIKNLRLFNPAGFKDRVMIDMPEIYVAYDLPSIIKGKIYLKNVRIYLKEFMVVKNENGKLNLDSLKVVQAQKEGAKPAEKAKKEGDKPPEIMIDTLHLKIEKAIYKDYSKGYPPRVMEFNINLDDEYKNIDNPYSVISLMVVKALENTAISRLANFDIQGVSDTLSTIQKIAPQALQGPVKAALQAAQTTGDIGDATKSAAGTAENVFKGIFNSGK